MLTSWDKGACKKAIVSFPIMFSIVQKDKDGISFPLEICSSRVHNVVGLGTA